MSLILWIDLETTGLDQNECEILEVAAIVTDKNLKEVDRYHSVVHQLEPTLRTMNQWCRDTHTKSGLLADVRASVQSLEQVENGLLELIQANFGNEKAILAGSSVHFDKKFIDKHMPKVAARLNYRIIDVSSFKETLRIVHGFELPEKTIAAHRALADIQGSMLEYSQYMNMIQVPA